jgi:hypothetical protein
VPERGEQEGFETAGERRYEEERQREEDEESRAERERAEHEVRRRVEHEYEERRWAEHERPKVEDLRSRRRLVGVWPAWPFILIAVVVLGLVIYFLVTSL